MVDGVDGLAVLVVAAGVEGLVEEDFTGLGVDGDGLAVVDVELDYGSGVVFTEIEGPASTCDTSLSDASAVVSLERSGFGSDVRCSYRWCVPVLSCTTRGACAACSSCGSVVVLSGL